MMATEFWEAAFQDKQEMWGWEPARSALITRDLFIQHKVKDILIPGIGYGRNAKPFIDSGMKVAGIEISATAIQIAQEHFSKPLTIHHGSVTEMPFDGKLYDGIFCYGLVYLLDKEGRQKLISDCYKQLAEGGIMVFTAITKDAETYGKGKQLSEDRFKMFGGVRIFFYDKRSIEKEFGNFGLVEVAGVEENYPFYLIQCRKGNTK